MRLLSPSLVCLDMEGVLTPEIWVSIAEKTGIEELRRTTRDEPDYDALMRGRLQILRREGLKLPDIQKVIAGLKPLEGAVPFLDRLRAKVPVVILSDTFYQFAGPLIAHLGFPILFCHTLEVDAQGVIQGYRLRMPDQKREAVRAFKALRFKVIAGGDSYNDTSMLMEADHGILFRAPKTVAEAFPQFPLTHEYAELMQHIERLIDLGDSSPAQNGANAKQAVANIRVERPTQERLKTLGVTQWPIWTKEPSVFDWTYDEEETCYFLEGQVMVKTQEGACSIGKGDLVTFPRGLSCTWQVSQPVKKHYRFGQ